MKVLVWPHTPEKVVHREIHHVDHFLIGFAPLAFSYLELHPLGSAGTETYFKAASTHLIIVLSGDICKVIFKEQITSLHFLMSC